MPYVQRNQSGAIVSLTVLPVTDIDQFMLPDNPEIVQFLAQPAVGEGDNLQNNVELFAADLKMIRVVEDLIDLLTDKGIIMFSELPIAVQEKVMTKRSKREKYLSSDFLVDDTKLPL